MEGNHRKYTNGEITVYWKPSKCIHATTCYRELIEVFNPRKRPWVDMNGASTNEIIRVVNLCPTKALSYKWNKDIENDTPSKINEEEIVPGNAVKVMEDGPLILKGNFKIFDTDGKEIRKSSIVSLCRCGESKNIPYCDGTHRKIGFHDKNK